MRLEREEKRAHEKEQKEAEKRRKVSEKEADRARKAEEKAGEAGGTTTGSRSSGQEA